MKSAFPDLIQRLKTDHYQDQNGNMVMTEAFHLRRGTCCGLGCRHCPYKPKHQAGNKDVSKKYLSLWGPKKTVSRK